jgi:hypothetical protein
VPFVLLLPFPFGFHVPGLVELVPGVYDLFEYSAYGVMKCRSFVVGHFQAFSKAAPIMSFSVCINV